MTAPDKQKHFLLMFIGTLVTSLLTRNTWLAGAIAMCIGIGKEVYDTTIGTTGFSVDDMVANTIGIFGAMLVYILISNNIIKEE